MKRAIVKVCPLTKTLLKKETLVVCEHSPQEKIWYIFVSVEPVAQGGEYVKEINSLKSMYW